MKRKGEKYDTAKYARTSENAIADLKICEKRRRKRNVRWHPKDLSMKWKHRSGGPGTKP